MKDDNTIFWIIGIAIVVFIILPKIQVQEQEEMIGLTPHYYKDGIEVFPQKGLFGFSIVTPPGGSFDQIAFDISAINTGETLIENIQIIDASPISFKDALITTPQSLEIGESKILWTSELMNTVQFEAVSPVNFWVEVSGLETYANTTISLDRVYSGDIIFEAESVDGILIFTSTTKSYGNLILDTDYKVSGDTLYLKTDREFDFINFTLGSGMDLAPLGTSGAVIYIDVKDTAKIDGTIKSNFANAYIPTRSDTVRSSFKGISTPNVASGGKGGYGGVRSWDNGGVGSSEGWGGGGAGGGVRINTGWALGGSGGPGGSNPVGGNSVFVSGGSGQYAGDWGTSSGGGSGAITAYRIPSGSRLTSGPGSSVHGGRGSWFSRLGNIFLQSDIDCGYAVGGGGGGGGFAGYSGIHFYLTSQKIIFRGVIDTSGGNGGNGGSGGWGEIMQYCQSFTAGEAGGGGGGGGGSAGDIVFGYTDSIEDTGTKIMTAGLGGSGGGKGNVGRPVGGDGTIELGSNGNIGGSGVSGTFTLIDLNL